MSDQQARIDAICRCCDEMAKIRHNFRDGKWIIAIDNTLGQCDWLDELHSLIYGESPEKLLQSAVADYREAIDRAGSISSILDAFDALLYGDGAPAPVGLLGTSWVTSVKSSIDAGNITLEMLQKVCDEIEKIPYTRNPYELDEGDL